MYFWVKVVEMDEKYNETMSLQFRDLLVLSLVLMVVPATSTEMLTSE